MMAARCSEEFALAEERRFEPMSTWSVYQGMTRLHRLTLAELERIEYRMARNCNHWFISPYTERVEYDMSHTPERPSVHGFWFRIPRKYAPIVTNWPALREAALRFLKEDTKKLTPEQMRAKEKADIHRRREEAHRIIQERLDYVKRLKEYKLK